MTEESPINPEHVAGLRKALGWTQQQLAAEIGVDQATVSRIENGAEPRGPVRVLLKHLLSQTIPIPDDAGDAPVEAAGPMAPPPATGPAAAELPEAAE